VSPLQAAVVAGDDAADARWFDARKHGKLAFDHDRIVKTALERLAAKVRYQPIGFELLPKKFTLGALQRLYEHILGRALDKRNFRRTMLSMRVLDELDEWETGVSHRPSRLYRFNRTEYRRLSREGLNFEI
jgi:8-oxo-dGTP diphosphatase